MDSEQRAAQGSPEDIAWMVLRARLVADSEGREILLRLATAPAEGAELLRRYLDTSLAGPGLSTIVTGGTVDRLVNIAQAGVVNIAMQRQVAPPRQLPPAIADFTDRASAVERIERAVAQGASRLFAILGGGGVGKTALAVIVAHKLTRDYADVQLYVDLAGGTSAPRSPHAVLEGLLRALGAEADTIPEDTEERAGHYRAMLSQRRGVVLLDNAASVAQLRPLLPGPGTNVVLVTSRDPLVGLPDADRLSLDVFAPADAIDLLGRIIGDDRARVEDDTVAELATLCGYLPLALRIAAARLASRPHWTVRKLVTRLDDENRRLSELVAGDLAVRASFAVSHEGLDPAARRVFRLAALIPGQSFPAWVVAALTDATIDEAEDVVDQLVDLRLLEFAGTDGSARLRYRFHDLLRLFARERLAEEEDATERQRALERLLGAYLVVSRRGLYLLSPHSKRDPVPGLGVPWAVPAELVDELMADPYLWFTDEHTALVGAVRLAYDQSLWALTYELAEQLHYYFRVRGHLSDWVDTHELALTAARNAGDRRAEGWTLRNLGNAHQDQGRYGDAATCFADASTIFLDLGNTLGSAATLCNLGETRMVQGVFTEAVDYLTRCLPEWQAADDQIGIAYTIDNLGYIALRQGDFDTATTHLRRSLDMFVDLGDRFGEAHSLRRRAELHVELGMLVDADRDLDRARSLFRETGSATGTAWTAVTAAAVRLAQGSLGDALDAASEAVTTFQTQSDPRAGAQAMACLGEVLLASARADEAVAVLDQAATVLNDLGDAFGAALATYHLGRALGSTSDRGNRLLHEAATMFSALPSPLWEHRARA